MSAPFVAEIRIVGFNFAPTGWASCDGQLMPISQNTALFSLLGTTYGGNGISTFALPNFQGSAPMMWGQGAGLSLHDIGEVGGVQNVTLLSTEIPAHTHTFTAIQGGRGNVSVPTGNSPSTLSTGNNAYSSTKNTNMSPLFVQPTQSQPHNNMQPFLTLFFIIALQGIFPARG